jgi:hypothetical protein
MVTLTVKHAAGRHAGHSGRVLRGPNITVQALRHPDGTLALRIGDRANPAFWLELDLDPNELLAAPSGSEVD